MRAPGSGRVRPAFETAILLASVGALALPPAAGPAAFAALILLWLAARPPRRERLFVGAALALAAGLLLTSALSRRLGEASLDDWVGEVESGFGGVWDELAAAAGRAAGGLGAPARPGDERGEFEALEALLPEAPSDLTFLLLDPAGTAYAWAGEGLLHEGDLAALPALGFASWRGYNAATLLAVAPLSDSPRPWRLVAGRSLPADRLPFATSSMPRPAGLRWAPAPAGATPPDGVLVLAHAAAPAIYVERPRQLESRWRRLAGRARPLAAGLLGLTLLALALLRSTGDRLLLEASERRPPPGVPLLALAGSAALGMAMRFSPALALALAGAVGLAVWGLIRRRRPALRAGAGMLWGALAPIFLAAAAYLYQRSTGAQDLSSSFAGDAETLALCLVWCLAALGLLALAAPRDAPFDGDRSAWWATLLLLAAGASCDFPRFALPLLAAAGAAVVRWLGGIDLGRRPTALGGLLVLAALTGGASWETAYRDVFRRELTEHDLPRLAPPTLDERHDIHLEVFEHFDRRDVSDLLFAPAGPVDPRDLAYVLWRDSPLAARDALSALAVETVDGQRSSFSFGLSLDDDFELALPPDRWDVPPAPQWHEAILVGRSELQLAGKAWGVVRYWLVLRPGFRLESDEIGELEESLLRGGPRARALDGLPRGVLYGLYDRDGRAITSPWSEAPPLDSALLEPAARVASVATPGGRAWVWRRLGADGHAVLYLPRLTPRAGLERVGVHALGSLAWITAIGLLALALALPRAALRAIFERAVRSYSKRMILVYTVLLLLPLIALNVVLMRSFAERERLEQRAAARSALSSARLFLLDYIAGLEPGFDLEIRVNSALMGISSIIEHPINFYWGSGVYASSQQELFTAGLLPRRIPGEVYSRLALSGYKMGFRQHRGDLRYLELYAPLEVGGGGAARHGFFLSVPLLEQEEEVARELAALRRRALLVTSALVMLLLAVGSRLARGFTKPLMEIIGGTRRIAEGATGLDVTPREHELEALADAIDDMARRIAEGRRKLVLEKQVVDRIVDSITSGVVSLDRDQCVLLQNRVAAERLGTEVGTEIEVSLGRDPRLRPVLDFLRSTGPAGAQATVELRLEEGAEAREWTLTWVPIPGSEAPAALLVVDDATEVLRGERLEAWAEMARIIAHEIKNPLTPIRLSADHMRQVYAHDRERFDEVFERCTGNILRQVEELADIASGFSIYSRIPRAQMAAGDLVAVLAKLVASYRDAAGSGTVMTFSAAVPELRARFDPKLLTRAVRNVIENALRASGGRGEVELAITLDAEAARIRVADSGPGVDPELLPRVFEPYFSTYDSGTGLGLAITRRIVVEHGGDIEARNRPGGGLEVAITIPLATAGSEPPLREDPSA